MNTDISTDLPTEVTQTVTYLIAAARARAQTYRAEAEEADSRQREILAGQEQDRLQKDLEILVAYVPSWAHEYFDERTTDVDEYTTLIRRALNLPGCSQIGIIYDREGVHDISVVEPKSIYFSSNAWRLGREEHYVHTFEEAVDMAADWGESWHEMSTEMARRNLLGLRPEPAPAIPDPIDQARQLVNMLSNDERIKRAITDDFATDTADSRTLVLASVGLAIAYHISRVADALESKGI
jgi:hypothetical protein